MKKEKSIMNVVNLSIMILLILVGTMSIPIKSNAANQSASAKAAYNKMLSKSSIIWNGVNGGSGQRYSTKNMKFSLIDIDDDKTPELIVYCGDAFGAEGPERVYTYKKGKVTCIYASSNCDTVEIVYPSKKLFVNGGGRMSTVWKYYQVYKNGVVTQKAGEWLNFRTKKIHRYFVDGKNVTKSVYTKTIKKLTKGAVAKKIKLCSNTRANRNKYLLESKPSIKIKATERVFVMGDSYIFKASKKNTSGKITWSVSNKSLASINKSTGKFKALRPGKVIIYASIGKAKTSASIQIKKRY